MKSYMSTEEQLDNEAEYIGKVLEEKDNEQ